MLSIALCDDDELTMDTLAEMLQEYGKQNHCPLRISKYTTGSMLIQGIGKEEPIDIFILDYNIPFINGVDTARMLREKGEEGIIIFLSSSMDGVIDAFEVNAFRYLMKPISKEALANALNPAIEQLKKSNCSAYEIRTPDGIRRVRKNEIVFIEKTNRSLKFHMSDGEEISSTTIQGSVKNAVASLIENPEFIMAGSSLVLNLGRIESVSHGDVFFDNGDEITPPRREYPSVRTSWNEYGIE